MNKIIIGLLAFGAGVALGYFITVKKAQEEYRQIAKEEIEEIREFYRKKEDGAAKQYNNLVLNYKGSDEEELSLSKNNKKELNNIDEIVEYNTEEGGAEAMKDDIYIIPEEEFGELDDYSSKGLVYYNDEVLADYDDEPIEDVSYYVGDEFMDYLNEEDNVVYVRNDRLKCDYEILLSARDYYEDNT